MRGTSKGRTAGGKIRDKPQKNEKTEDVVYGGHSGHEKGEEG